MRLHVYFMIGAVALSLLVAMSGFEIRQANAGAYFQDDAKPTTFRMIR